MRPFRMLLSKDSFDFLMRTRHIDFLKRRKFGSADPPTFFERKSTGLVPVVLVFNNWNASPHRDAAVTGDMLALEVVGLDNDSISLLDRVRVSHAKVNGQMWSTHEGGGRKKIGESTDWVFYLAISNEKEPV
jgi:hypothetical protein